MNTQQLSLFSDQQVGQPQKIIRKRRLPYYAVIETGDDPAIWGIAKKREAVVYDALDSLTSCLSIYIDDLDDLNMAIQTGELIIARCSRKLFKEVFIYGGHIEFVYMPAIGVMLPEEKT